MAMDKGLIDQLLADYKKPEDIIGENGLLKQRESAGEPVPIATDTADLSSQLKQGLSYARKHWRSPKEK